MKAARAAGWDIPAAVSPEDAETYLLAAEEFGAASEADFRRSLREFEAEEELMLTRGADGERIGKAHRRVMWLREAARVAREVTAPGEDKEADRAAAAARAEERRGRAGVGWGGREMGRARDDGYVPDHGGYDEPEADLSRGGPSL